jgi:hypothetical protein
MSLFSISPMNTSAASIEASENPPAVSSPTKYYRFIADSDGYLHVPFTPRAKKLKGRLIYKIVHEKSNRSYTGKTERGIVKRTSSHLSGVRHPEKSYGQKELYDDIRRSPTKFKVGIQMVAGENNDLDELEKVCIAANRSIETGYNSNSGGGGGTASIEPDILPNLPKEAFTTPTKKGYPLHTSRDGRIRVALTPTVKKVKKVVYGFRDDEGKWLIGETGQTLAKRLYGYHSAFNNPSTDKGSLPLPVAVRRDPSRFKFYVLHQGENIKGMEKAWIKAKKEGLGVYNLNKGGGGPSAKS